jgi:hypothetical protein
MATNSKPRKARTHRILTIPKLFNILSIRDEQPMLAMQIYGRIESFLTNPTIAAGNALCEILCQIAAGLSIIAGGAGLRQVRDQHSVAVVSAIAALEDVSQRHRKHGDVTVRATEAATLNAAAGKLDEALGRIPVHVWNEGCMDVKIVTTKIDMQAAKDRRMAEKAAA